MRLNKKVGIVVWLLCLALAIFLLLILPDEYSTSIWITLVFTVIAFASQLIMWLSMFKTKESPEGVFYKTPSMTISSIYLVIQVIICMVTALTNIGTKGVLIVNFVVLILAWIILFMLSASSDHAKRIDSRQKDHHTEL